MGSAFDGLQNAVFNMTTAIFGYSATWQPTIGGASHSAKVHFKNPSDEIRMAGVELQANEWMAEYKDGDFPGLKEAVDKRDSKEKILIDGVYYWVKTVSRFYDGKTYRADIQPV